VTAEREARVHAPPGATGAQVPREGLELLPDGLLADLSGDGRVRGRQDVDVDERHLRGVRREDAGERDGVAAALAAVDADDRRR
jgi:hypothetical protein